MSPTLTPPHFVCVDVQVRITLGEGSRLLIKLIPRNQRYISEEDKSKLGSTYDLTYPIVSFFIFLVNFKYIYSFFFLLSF